MGLIMHIGQRVSFNRVHFPTRRFLSSSYFFCLCHQPLTSQDTSPDSRLALELLPHQHMKPTSLFSLYFKRPLDPI